MLNTKLAPASDPSKKVSLELEGRLARRKDAGVIDMKAMCSPDRNSSSKDKLWTLNNVLRCKEAGYFKSDIISK